MAVMILDVKDPSVDYPAKAPGTPPSFTNVMSSEITTQLVLESFLPS